jgi:hypothetical protein
MIEITLNQLAINDINALLSTGGSSLFALGGNLETVNTLENRVFGNTSYGSFTRALSVEYGNISTVPIPAAAWLFGSGLIGMIGVAKRKKV